MKELTAEERKEAVYAALRPAAEREGFAFLPAKNQFRKTVPEGFQTLIVSLSPYQDLTLFELHLGIRNDSIENLAFQFTNGLPLFEPDSMTLVISAGKLRGKRFARHEIKTQTDAENAVRTELQSLEKEGYAWLKNHQTLTALDRVLNDEPLRPSPLMPNRFHRCLRGLVAAKLSGREDYRSTEKEYRVVLKELSAPPYKVENYERLADFLRDYSAN